MITEQNISDVQIESESLTKVRWKGKKLFHHALERGLLTVNSIEGSRLAPQKIGDLRQRSRRGTNGIFKHREEHKPAEARHYD